MERRWKCLPEKGISLAQIFGDCQSQHNLLLHFRANLMWSTAVLRLNDFLSFSIFVFCLGLSTWKPMETIVLCKCFLSFLRFLFVCYSSWSDTPTYRQGLEAVGQTHMEQNLGHNLNISVTGSLIQSPNGQKSDSIWLWGWWILPKLAPLYRLMACITSHLTGNKLFLTNQWNFLIVIRQSFLLACSSLVYVG